MRHQSNSKQGFEIEKEIATTLMSLLPNDDSTRLATKHEQITEYTDLFLSGVAVDIKYQPQAYKYKTINIELTEYNTADPHINMDSWWHRSKATQYIWVTGCGIWYFDKHKLEPYIQQMLSNNPKEQREAKLNGLIYSPTNNAKARAASINHSGTKYDNATTIRVPIKILSEIGTNIDYLFTHL